MNLLTTWSHMKQKKINYIQDNCSMLSKINQIRAPSKSAILFSEGIQHSFITCQLVDVMTQPRYSAGCSLDCLLISLLLACVYAATILMIEVFVYFGGLTPFIVFV